MSYPSLPHHQVLRFLRLFGPGKNMPSVWRSARRKKKRKHRDPQPGTPPPEGLVAEAGLELKSGWMYEPAPPPPPEQCLSDDEVRTAGSLSHEASWHLLDCSSHEVYLKNKKIFFINSFGEIHSLHHNMLGAVSC